MLHRLSQYIKALADHWLAILGSAILLVPAAMDFFFPSFGHKYLDPLINVTAATKWVPWVGFCSLILWATFLAWKEERHAREKAENQVSDLKRLLKNAEDAAARERRTIEPRITLDLENVRVNPVADVAGSIEIIVQAAVQNTGQETDVHNWKLRQSGGLRDCTYLGPSSVVDRTDRVPRPNHGRTPDSPRDFTVTIGRNKKWTGWIIFATLVSMENPDAASVEEVVEALRSPRTRWTLSFEDMDRHTYFDSR